MSVIAGYDRTLETFRNIAVDSTGNLNCTVLQPTASSLRAVVHGLDASGVSHAILTESSGQARVIIDNWQTFAHSSVRSLDVSTTSTQVVATTGYIYSIFVTNQNVSTANFLKCYTSATASSSDVPIITIALPPLSSNTYPINFNTTTGFCIRATTGIADANNVSPTANDVVCTVTYNM